MSDLVENANPLEEVKEQITEVLELLNQPNLPIIIPEDSLESTLLNSTTDLPITSKAE
jgi:hypothetical protein